MEAAIKLCKQYWVENGESQRKYIIARSPSYHGNTLGALAVSFLTYSLGDDLKESLPTDPDCCLRSGMYPLDETCTVLSLAISSTMSLHPHTFDPIIQARVRRNTPSDWRSNLTRRSPSSERRTSWHSSPSQWSVRRWESCLLQQVISQPSTRW